MLLLHCRIAMIAYFDRQVHVRGSRKW